MSKSRDAFRTISEVADLLDTPAHVLRFWESKFAQLKPVKRAGGRRYYRPTDVSLIAGIKKLLHDDGMTIKGAQKLLREQGVKHVQALGAQVLDTPGETAAENVVDAAAADTTNVVPLPSSEASDPPPANAAATGAGKPAAQSSDSLETADNDPAEQIAAERAPDPDPKQDPEIDKSWRSLPPDPADTASKLPARVFHFLRTADREVLAARAEDIAPLLDRMQVLRDRISLR